MEVLPFKPRQTLPPKSQTHSHSSTPYQDLQLVESVTTAAAIVCKYWERLFHEGKYEKGKDAILLLNFCYGYVCVCVLGRGPCPGRVAGFVCARV